MNRKESSKIGQAWPQAGDFRRSIRLEFSLYVSLIILVLMSVTGYVITEDYIDTVSRGVVEKLLVQARSYSGSASKLIISTNGPDALLLNNVCNKLLEDNPEVYWAGITGEDNVFLAHSDIRKVVTGARLESRYAEGLEHDVKPGELIQIVRDTIRVQIPIKESGILVGRLALASSSAQIAAARRNSITKVASITVIMILLGLPLTMLILNRKLRPVSIIADSLKQVDIEEISLNIPVRSKNEFGYLAETLRMMGARLNIARKELIENERMGRELEIAREIQANMLPREYPVDPRLEFAGAYSSAREVGGDYYDFIEFGEDKLAFLVADVSGKSLPGMLMMLLTRDMVRRIARPNRSPAEVLTEVNDDLLANIKKGMFVTMFYGLLEKSTGRFTFASAGHNPLIKVNDATGDVALIKTRGFPLGMMRRPAFEARVEAGELVLGSNDWLLQYTDGINEARNEAEEEFGMDRFVELVSARTAFTARRMVEETLAEHRRFVGQAPQYDDITLLAMKWRGSVVDNSNERSGETVYAGRN